MTDLTQKFPVEILAEILGHATVPDVLNLRQVNRALRSVILGSPLLQHKIELYGAGLVYNATSGFNVAESRKAFVEYSENVRSLKMIKKQIGVEWIGRYAKVEGGVYATTRDPVKVLAFGSVSRRVPIKEWEISHPVDKPTNYCFYPVADVIAFFKQWETNDLSVEIHVRSLSDGMPHPAAQSPIIRYSRSDDTAYGVASVSVTKSRLMMFTFNHGRLDRRHLVVWDWRTAKLLFELEGERCHTPEFIDDYLLLVILVSERAHEPSSLVLINTARVTEGVPTRTTLHLPPEFSSFKFPYLLLERGLHEPPPAEMLAPFHHDPSQRIVALAMPGFGYPVFRAAALLELHKSHEGSEIEWDEWRKNVFAPSFPLTPPGVSMGNFTFGGDPGVWLSGCRLFFVHTWPRTAQVGVCDFSVQSFTRNLSKEVDNSMGGIKSLVNTGERGHPQLDDTMRTYHGHDCLLISGCRDAEGYYPSMDGQFAMYMVSF